MRLSSHPGQPGPSARNNPDVVAATMSKPGVVLKRPAGSNGRFAEDSDLPSDLGSARAGLGGQRHRPKPANRDAPKISEREARRPRPTSRRRKRREAERRRKRPPARDRKRREKAMAKAQAALDQAERR